MKAYFVSITCFKIGAWNGFIGRVNIAFRTRSLDEGIMPTGFHLNKKQAFVPVLENVEEKWKTVLLTAEKDLALLLLAESDKVVAKIEFEIGSNLKIEDPVDFKKKIMNFWKANMLSTEAILKISKRDVIGNVKSLKKDIS